MDQQSVKKDERRGQSHGDADVTARATQVDRRTMLAGAAIAAGATVIGTGESQAETPPEKLTPQEGDRFMFIKGPNKDKCVKPEMLTTSERQIEVFPYDPDGKVLRRKNRLNRALVIRLDPKEMDEETRERSVEGVLLYSAICTHKGCTIKSWKQEERHLRCHCHLSEFAALSAGSVKSGPAKRQLPMVELGLDDEGFIVAKGDFTRKPGGSKK